ncbi:MAG: TetM/TetW/TetO/TetS family tetracycline resistance ribosomal protection protein [Lachnospiraceae bacterium]|nr:TetM/TetW/TetO/TetS family tetracycline resistance ribosomal protection protein [Lachnospiraceae bacterium]
MQQQSNKNLVVGILAHVDAGKTTLAEGILYTCGKIRKLGRVDHKDAFLDNFALERARGITIFSKQAQITLGELNISLLDTPGHVDFSAEMERTLQVLDYAILVISGADGVQGHVLTLWRLLKRYDIPVFLFINKMDQEGTDRERLLQELQTRLDEHCIWCGPEAEECGREEFLDAAAMCSEGLMEEYLESGELSEESIAEAIANRQVFPCYFGSALKLAGVEALLQWIQSKALLPEYPSEFGARVFKIARDNNGKRLTYLKVTGGCLRVKMPLTNASSAESPEEVWEQKADELRIYEGAGYSAVDEVNAGGVCAVTGLACTFAGQGLGYEEENALPVLEPVLTYQMLLPEEWDAISVLGQLRQLEEEEPLLHILWKEEVRELHVQVMGEVQLEILRSLLQERFGIEAAFGTGSIVYKETMAEPVVGIGHFEPLRHYAEVQLLLEPGERGSGLQFASVCSEDILDKNWQRLVLTHLEEKRHVGVLTGSEITDLRIVLLAGRAHQKHTEGGDFRQATYRAIRQGLRSGKNILLEPYFSFTLEVPTEVLGRAMSDVQRMYGCFEVPETMGEMSILRGKAPVATMRDYQREVNAYTRGHGRISVTVCGYEPCHNAEEIVERIQYDPEQDLANPTASVFCAHGAGFLVPKDQVEEYAHMDVQWRPQGAEEGVRSVQGNGLPGGSGRSAPSDYISQEEIEEIFRQTYGKKEVDKHHYRRYHRSGARRVGYEGATGSRGDSYTGKPGETDGRSRPSDKKEAYLLVDGYNIIFAWEELRTLAARNIDSARDRLMDIMSNYQGYLGSTLILVFDAYKVKGNPGSVQQYHNIYVVYTKEAETADQYIEKTVHEMGKKYDVTVATSDGLEQMIIWGDGAIRMSALGLLEAVQHAESQMREAYLDKGQSIHYHPFEEQ